MIGERSHLALASELISFSIFASNEISTQIASKIKLHVALATILLRKMMNGPPQDAFAFAGVAYEFCGRLMLFK